MTLATLALGRAIQQRREPMPSFAFRRQPFVMLCGMALLLLSFIPARAEGCGTPPAPMRDITANSYYTDAHHSVIDKAALARNVKSAKPLNDYETAVARYATRAQKGSAAWGQCAGRWLAAWARGGALLGHMSSMQAEFERKWAVARLAMAYLRAEPQIAPADRAAIAPWLARVAHAVDAYHRTKLGHLRNNHYTWLGYALMAAGAAANDAALIKIAETIYDDTLRQIAADGHLPLEAARGKRALHYHAFTVLPLVMMAELAARRGEDWYAKDAGALHRLIRFTLANARDPAPLKRLAGVAQEPLKGSDFGWMPLYGKRFPARVEADAARVTRHYWIRWAGGDMNVLAAAWVK